MDLFLVVSQGVGLSVATGVRPFLPPLLAGALARADIGLDFSGTDFSFLESVPFLAAMVALTVLGTLRERGGAERMLTIGLGVVAVAIGALEFAGSLADEDYAAAPGLAAGAVCALVAYAATLAFLGRARDRLAARGEEEPAPFLTLFADGASLSVAALAILAPPASYLALAFCAWVLLERRRREGRKYEGLRVLR